MARPPQNEKKELCLYLYYGKGIHNLKEIARRVEATDTSVKRWIKAGARESEEKHTFKSPLKDAEPQPTAPAVEITNVYVENPPVPTEDKKKTWEEGAVATAEEILQQTRYLRLNLFGKMQVVNDNKEFSNLAAAWKTFFDIEYKLNSLEYLDINRAVDQVVKHRADLNI